MILCCVKHDLIYSFQQLSHTLLRLSKMMAALLAAFLRMASRRKSTTPVPLSCNWYSTPPPPRKKEETIASSETVVRVVSTLLSSRLRFETDYIDSLFLLRNLVNFRLHVLFISLNSNSSAKLLRPV